MKRTLLTLVIAAAAAGLMISAQAQRSPLPSCDPANGGLMLPAGFCAVVAADNLGIGRQMVVAPNGDLFVSLRDQAPQNAAPIPGAILALRDNNGDGTFEVAGTVRRARRHRHRAAARLPVSRAGDGVVRYPLKTGELKPSGPAEVDRNAARSAGHTAKGLAFDGKGGMYVNVGAPSNACQATGPAIGSRARPARIRVRCSRSTAASGASTRTSPVSRSRTADGGTPPGMRQFYALAWHDGALYAVQHGRDQLDTLFPQNFTAKQNAELPSEELLRIEDGAELRLAVLLSRLAAGQARADAGVRRRREEDRATAPSTRRRSRPTRVTGRQAR